MQTPAWADNFNVAQIPGNGEYYVVSIATESGRLPIVGVDPDVYINDRGVYELSVVANRDTDPSFYFLSGRYVCSRFTSSGSAHEVAVLAESAISTRRLVVDWEQASEPPRVRIAGGIAGETWTLIVTIRQYVQTTGAKLSNLPLDGVAHRTPNRMINKG
jgi:hypothetical protein